MLTRSMSKNTVISAILNDIVNHIVKSKRKVLFHSQPVTETREFVVEKHMHRTPYTNVGLKALMDEEEVLECKPVMAEKVPLLCRSEPMPLSVIWKIADEIRQKRILDLEKFIQETELNLLDAAPEYVTDQDVWGDDMYD
jgi:hypothetical protein